MKIAASAATSPRFDLFAPEFEALDSQHKAELRALAAEDHGPSFRSGIFALASRLENSGQGSAARSLYAALPEDVRARGRKAALEGRGDFGQNVEIQLRRLVGEASRPSAILPMLAGSATFGLARGVTFGRLASAAPRWWSRGAAARLGATAIGFSAELTAFTFAARGLRPASEFAPGLGGDLAHGAMTLGLFKIFGAAGQSAAGRLGWRPTLMGQAGIFAGLLAVQGLETRLGLRSESTRAAALTEALASLLSMNVGARLGQGLLGRRYAQFLRELELRAASASPQMLSRPGSEVPGFRLAAATGISKGAADRPGPESTLVFSRGGSASPAKPRRGRGLRELQKLIDHEFLPEAWRAFPQFKELKSQFTPRDFRIIEAKLGPLFEDPAMMRRAYAFIFLDRLVPGLSPFRRKKQLARIDRGLLDSSPWVRELAVQSFDRNAAFWPREELVKRIPDLHRLTRDPERKVQEAAFRGLVRMTEFLAPDQRMGHLRGLVRHFVRTGDVGHFKTLPMNRALRSLPPPDRLKVVLEFERVLARHGEGLDFIPFFGDMIARLEPSDQVGRIRALELCYGHSDPLTKVLAMTAVDNNMERLPRREWVDRILRFEGMLRSREDRVRERAVTILGGLLSSEPGFLDSWRVRSLESRLSDADPRVRDAAWTAQERIARSLDPQGRRDLLQRLVGHWSGSRGEARERAAETLREIYLGMKVRERQDWGRTLLASRRGRPLPQGLVLAFAEPGKTN